MTTASLTAYLHDVRLDWANFEQAGDESRRILARLVSDRDGLSELVRSAPTDPRLRSMCESHQLLDYLVIYDALERGLRLRLHVSTADHLQRPHDHRFDFSSCIIRGFYEHCLFTPLHDPYSLSPEAHAIAFQDKDHPDPRARLTNEDFRTAFVRNETAGDTYTFSHELVHTVYTTANTVSLVLRGPPRRNRSFIFDRQYETLWWRFGQENETKDRRQSKTMTDEHLRHTLGKLEDLRILSAASQS